MIRLGNPDPRYPPKGWDCWTDDIDITVDTRLSAAPDPASERAATDLPGAGSGLEAVERAGYFVSARAAGDELGLWLVGFESRTVDGHNLCDCVFHLLDSWRSGSAGGRGWLQFTGAGDEEMDLRPVQHESRRFMFSAVKQFCLHFGVSRIRPASHPVIEACRSRIQEGIRRLDRFPSSRAMKAMYLQLDSWRLARECLHNVQLPAIAAYLDERRAGDRMLCVLTPFELRLVTAAVDDWFGERSDGYVALMVDPARRRPALTDVERTIERLTSPDD